MEKKTVLVLMLQPLLMGMLMLTFDIQPVRADWALTETVYIMADGNVVPDTAPISSIDNITYTLTDNIVNQAIAGYTIDIARDNIVFDGAGYTLQGNDTGWGWGIRSGGTKNVTVKNVQIKGYGTGIAFETYSRNITISGNTIEACDYAVYVGGGYLTISGNNITNNLVGIHIGGSGTTVSRNYIVNNTYGISSVRDIHDCYILENSIVNNTYGIDVGYNNYNNTIYHNNFIDNDEQVYSRYEEDNVWDDDYPSGGNYWSDYLGGDVKSGSYQNETGSDGIGDTPYNITASTTDRFPLMGPFSSFTAGSWDETTYSVHTVSNSAVSDFYFNPDEGAVIHFNVTGLDGTAGFSRVAFPKQLLWVENGWVVLVDGEPAVPTVTEDAEYTYLYFTYSHSKKTVEIQGTNVIPEFPTWTAILLVLVAVTVAIAIHKQRLLKPSIN